MTLTFQDGPLKGEVTQIADEDIPRVFRAGITTSVRGIPGWHLYSPGIKPSERSLDCQTLPVYFRKTVSST